MPNCIYCGEKAGLLRNEHASCRDRAESSTHDLYQRVKNLGDEQTVQDALHDLQTTIVSCHLPIGRKHSVGQFSLDCIADHFAKAGDIDDDSWHSLLAAGTDYGTDVSKSMQMGRPGLYYAALARDLWCAKNGISVTDKDAVQFRYEIDEHPLCTLALTTLIHEVRHPGRRYAGVSVPIIDGISVFASGRSKDATGFEIVDKGDYVVTNRNIYYGGQEHTIKVPLSSLIRIEYLSDGIYIVDSREKVHIFGCSISVVKLGWFHQRLMDYAFSLV